MAASVEQGSLLSKPSDHNHEDNTRAPSAYTALSTFQLAKGDAKHYKQQYGDMYFLRLAMLKPAIEAHAQEAWEGYEIAGEAAQQVERVLDVRQGELSWVVGTIYMDMPLKPNILDDISKDHWIAAPPPRQKYLSPDGSDKVMLEDESGRLRLVGAALEQEMLVTGCIIAVLGTEQANGDFQVIDLKVPDLPSHPERWSTGTKPQTNGHTSATAGQGAKVAIISGLEITGVSGEVLAMELLAEWLLGESAASEQQGAASRVSRLIIAGNSLSEATPSGAREDLHPSATGKKAAAAKKYGYDASAYNPAPPQQLDAFLSTILPSIPVTLLPGPSDPANVSIPQQPLHPALFPESRAYAAAPPASAAAVAKKPQPVEVGSFHPTTNPTSFYDSGYLWLGTGGQPTDDIAKYLDPAPTLDLMEATLRWRLLAPTAPDTLWCYPFQSDDPFVLKDGRCPHLYFVGNQAEFGTRVVEGHNGAKVRLISVPKFVERGEVVLVDEETLETEIVRFTVHDEPTD